VSLSTVKGILWRKTNKISTPYYVHAMNDTRNILWLSFAGRCVIIILIIMETNYTGCRSY
jgi:membrane protease YdiL (CAAX protease family)